MLVNSYGVVYAIDQVHEHDLLDKLEQGGLGGLEEEVSLLG